MFLTHASFKLRRVPIWHVTTGRFKPKAVHEEEEEEEEIFAQILGLITHNKQRHTVSGVLTAELCQPLHLALFITVSGRVIRS